MINGRKVVVVMPAFNAAKTLEVTYTSIPHGFVDEILLVDDASGDDTLRLARELGLRVVAHRRNIGYGGNQKTCYHTALNMGADIVVMLHPDYQYPPQLIPAMVCMIAFGPYDVVLGSRVLVREALRGGMPVWKYASNRLLTSIQNVLWHTNISEYHTGFRAYTRRFLETIPFDLNMDDFAFDNQIIAQAVWHGFRIGEISCPTKYFPEASTISFRKATKYAFDVWITTLEFLMARLGIRTPKYLGGIQSK
jgi:glycosyltransferase involved in cell wall biosynthesis